MSFAQQQSSVVEVLSLNRSSFPTGFVFGTASAAYQVNIFLFSLQNPSYFTIFLCFFITCTYSMKVRQMKVEENQVYGMNTPINIQVLFVGFQSLII